MQTCTGVLHLPGNTSRVIMNIGSNIDPVLPPHDDPLTIAIAFEPVVGCLIKKHPRLYVVPAAVSAKGAWATMGVYNSHGLSSSLSAPSTKKARYMKLLRRAQPEVLFVPVLSMVQVLEGIPPEVEIWFIKTDMQGHDFEALAGGGELLKRVHYLRVEAWAENVYSYEGAHNDFCNDHFPYFTALGFEFVELTGYWKHHRFKGHDAAAAFCALHKDDKAHHGIRDVDAFWRRKGTTMPPPPSQFENPVMARRQRR